MFPKYAAVIQDTCSAPRGTQLTKYPSSRETIRQQNSRPGERLPHFIGRCSTRARAGPLARRYLRWTLRKVPRNLPRLVRFESPHIPRNYRATDRRDRQIGKTSVETSRQHFREVRLVPVKRHQSKANARPKRKTTKQQESADTIAQTGDLVLAEESSSNVERDGSSGKLEHERDPSPWKISKVLKRGLDNQSSPELAMYPPRK